MNDPMIIAAAMVLVIGSLTTAIVTIINTSKLKSIHGLVNSAASIAQAKLETLESEIKRLHSVIASLQTLRVEDAKDK